MSEQCAWERELARSLEPVRAPEILWSRVERRLDRPRRPRVALGAALLAAACVAAVFYVERPSPAIAIHREFLAHPERLDLIRCQPAQLHDWLARTTGLALTVAAHTAPDRDGLELVGARRLDSSRAAVFYRVGGRAVTLLIARAPLAHGSAKKIAIHEDATQNLKLYTWESYGQHYTLVSSLSADSFQACRLCHVS